jgi:hypothetical protein
LVALVAGTHRAALGRLGLGEAGAEGQKNVRKGSPFRDYVDALPDDLTSRL